MRLEGKVALVTGGGTGIGAAVVEAFVREGAKVCITGRRLEMLEQVAWRLPEGKVAVCVGDVGEPEDVKRMVETAAAFGGRLDVVVNNAGMGVRATVADMDEAVWRKMLDVNLTGPFLVMKHAIPHLLRAGGGSIINVASVGAIRGLPEIPAYCAAKSGLLGLSRQVAVDYGPKGIRSNAVLPGAFRSEMFDRGLHEAAAATGTSVEERLKVMASPSPLKRIAFPSEIAGLFVYLASDESAYTTAGEFVCDAGVHALDASVAAGQ
ncbi:MAG: SDR family oxidoreductase [Acidobacteriota bacterium]|jgi:NAD(P)-dependent dehydrogenase (short-subunit alcohol dehydrogenase family)|nr:SDR family oxidoreductase [Acidobacteriota bacterium]